MKIATMRAIDAWVGRPLCAVATFLEKFRSANDPGPGERLLVMKLSEQGAVVVLGDSFRALGHDFAKDQTWFLAFDESRKILETLDFVPPSNLLFVSTRDLPSFFKTLIAALWKIRRLKFDTVLDLELFSCASALIAWLSGAPRRVGVHAYYGEGPYRGELMTHPVKYNPHLHISQMIRSLASAVTLPRGVLQRLDFIPPPVQPIADRFIPSPEQHAAIQTLLKECGWTPGERLVLLNSNISDRELIPLRKWDEENYAEVGRQLLAAYPDVRVLLTGSPKEQPDIEKLEAFMNTPRCRSVAGKTTLGELLTLYSCSSLMVTNDSGPAHFASLTDMPIIVLFGPETPSLWAPLGQNVRIAYRGLACSPCFSIINGRQSNCRKNICMDMSPDLITSYAHEILNAPPSDSAAALSPR